MIKRGMFVLLVILLAVTVLAEPDIVNVVTITDSTALEQELSNVTDFTANNIFSAEVTDSELVMLQQDPNVISVEPQKLLTITLQDSLPLIEANKANSMQIGGVNITGLGETVCVLDTGVDYTHPALTGKIINGSDFVNDDSDPMDDNRHGTHVAGIVLGVAPQARVYAIKVCNAAGTCSDTAIAQGIDECVANKTLYNISSISISIGDEGQWTDSDCFPTDVISIAAKAAIADGIAVFAASGNDGYTGGINYPACIGGVTSVGGTTKADGLYTSGNRYSTLDILAPGVSINSTRLGGGYITLTGTSMATPHASGASALLIQYWKLNDSYTLTPAEIQTKLQDGGVTVSSWKRIDIYQSLLLAKAPTIPVSDGGAGGGGGGGGGMPSGYFQTIEANINNQWSSRSSTPITARTLDNYGNPISVIDITISVFDMKGNRVYTGNFINTGLGNYSTEIPALSLGKYTVKIVGTGFGQSWSQIENLKTYEKQIEVVNVATKLGITVDKSIILIGIVALGILAIIILLIVTTPKKRRHRRSR